MLDFGWSFKPVLFLLQLMIGINLRTFSSLKSYLKETLSFWPIVGLLFGIAMLVCTVCIEILTAYLFLVKYTVEVFQFFNPDFSSANLLIIHITGANDMFENASIHFVLLYAILMGKWRSLWNILEQIEVQSYLDQEFYRSCRKYSVVGLSVIIVVKDNKNSICFFF